MTLGNRGNPIAAPYGKCARCGAPLAKRQTKYCSKRCSYASYKERQEPNYILIFAVIMGLAILISLCNKTAG